MQDHGVFLCGQVYVGAELFACCSLFFLRRHHHVLDVAGGIHFALRVRVGL